jgi:hypothetical protein
MTAASVSIVPAETAAPLSSDSILDRVLAGPLTKLADTASGLSVVKVDHPLDGIETVEDAAPIIGEMLAAERAGGKRGAYPRCILRQQHVVAFMLANPFATTTEICAFFGISPTTLCNISKSDTFKALINKHRVMIESGIGADIQEQLRATLAASIEVVQKSIVDNQDPEFALAALDKVGNRLGMGAKHNTNVQINNNIVTPQMIANARERRTSGAS